MKAIILAGGLGTRLREETEFRPKPLVEIGGRPILWHIMKHLSSHGISEFIVAVGYKGDAIKRYFLEYDARSNDFTIELGARRSLKLHGHHEESNWTVTVADTGLDSLTGDRVLHAAPYLEDEPFLVTYGDGVADVDVSSLIAHHQETQTIATVTTARPTSRFGVMEVAADGQVASFLEKPQLDGWINIGFFIFEPSVLEVISPGTPLETDPLKELATQGQLSAYRHEGFWQPMDTYREAQILNQLWESGDAPWKTW